MRNYLKLLFVAASLAFVLGAAGCSAGEGVEAGLSLGTPIHMEIPTNHLQPRMGLSGFIFGTFLLLNAYLMIICGCILMIVKDKTVQVILDTLRLGLQMFNPQADKAGNPLFERLAKGETRFQIGSAGLIAGVLLAYLGAWIAM